MSATVRDAMAAFAALATSSLTSSPPSSLVLPLAVAYSGGADSTALLLACAEQWPGQVGAIHVNHGLQAAASDFQRHCETVCQSLGVPLVVKRVDARAAPGQSPEEAARTARYQCFSAIAPVEWVNAAINMRANAIAAGGATGRAFEFFNANTSVNCIALAQHADDQVETLLLALSRGAGLAGLAAMPAHWRRGDLHFFRPFLGVSAADIRAWLAERGVAFIEDPTNTHLAFTRNRIRANLLPALQDTFAQFRDTFARSSAHAAQAQDLLNEVAAQDLNSLLMAPDQPAVLIAKIQPLSRPRQANVLRFWLKTRFHTTPSAAQLGELLHQVAACTTRGHRIHIKVGSGFVERQGDALNWYNRGPVGGL